MRWLRICIFLRLKNSGIIYALHDLRGFSTINLLILLWLRVALSGVHPSFHRDQLRHEPYLKEVIVDMKNLVLNTRSEFKGFLISDCRLQIEAACILHDELLSS